MSGTVTLENKWPVLGRHAQATDWLRLWTDLGRAPRTIDAYARGLAEYLQGCEREGVDPLTATRAHIGIYVRELTERPSLRGPNVVSIDSGSGLANATTGQRLVSVRLLRLPYGGRTTRLQSCWPGLIYARSTRKWKPAWACAQVDEATVDSHRTVVGGHPRCRRRRTGPELR